MEDGVGGWKVVSLFVFLFVVPKWVGQIDRVG